MLEKIHLSIIQQVEQQGSLTAAAEKLCLTQSALSHAIKKLEQQIGNNLWLREGRKLRLTQSGQFLLIVANKILPQLQQAEERLQQFAQGERGTLRIGMECHPCYQWLLKIVPSYLNKWKDVDVDVKQKFQFGGIGALLSYEIDILVTPDPIHQPELHFQAIFDYEQVLAVSHAHPFAQLSHITPQQLEGETLITYPVPTDRLDIYTQFLMPAGVRPRQHKTIETTDIMMQMVANHRGVTALPKWLVKEYEKKMHITAVRLGKKGIAKQLYVGTRKSDNTIDYLQDFIRMANAKHIKYEKAHE